MCIRDSIGTLSTAVHPHIGTSSPAVPVARRAGIGTLFSAVHRYIGTSSTSLHKKIKLTKKDSIPYPQSPTPLPLIEAGETDLP